MSPIVTLTLNPALDLSAETEHVVPGPKLRCTEPRADPGGGGVNVSRAIRILGGTSKALVALGGATGARLAGLLAEEGIDPVWLDAPGETRHSLAVTDISTGGQYRFVLPGPIWDDAHVARAIERIVAEAAGALVVISGSLPPGAPADLPLILSRRLAASGARVIADTSGAPLRHLAAGPAGLAVLRMDEAEAEDIAGRPLPGPADTAAYAGDLVGRGVADAVILARGAAGNVLVTANGAWLASAPQAQVASAVGAGDSFTAALALAMASGESLPECLRRGTATASAAVLTEATELCRREDVERILPLTLLEAL